MSFQYVKENYRVPACLGRRVIVNGKHGTIAADRGSHIGVNFDSDKPGVILNAHPTWEVTYLDEIREVRKPTRAQERYQRFIEYGDGFHSFLDFCYWDATKKWA